MRFMVLVKANEESEAGVLPSAEILTAMGKYNEELVKAGVMVAGEGLHPSSRGVRVRFSGDQRTVVDGPFPETKELLAGFWLIDVKSRQEALEWASRCPVHASTSASRRCASPTVRAVSRSSGTVCRTVSANSSARW